MTGITAVALVPVFFGLALGYLAGKRGIVAYKDVEGLNTFLLNYAVPAALFLAAAQTPRHALISHGKLSLALSISMVSVFFGTLILEVKAFKFTPADSSALLLAVSSPNFIAVAFPVFIALYGPQSTAPVAVAVLCGNMVIVPLTLLLLEAGCQPSAPTGLLNRYFSALLRSVKKPVVLAPAFGLCLSLASYAVPPVWVRSLDFFAATVPGVSLFVTGVVLSRESFFVDLNVFCGLLIKLILQPLLTFAIALFLLDYPAQIVRDAVLLMACPGGFFGILFAVNYNARTREAVSLLLLSSAACALTLSIVIPLLAFIR
jgi:predicted permease